jgi:hypothetical protein
VRPRLRHFRLKAKRRVAIQTALVERLTTIKALHV